MVKARSIDAYIKGFPPHTQALLRQIRKTIAKTAPDAVEKISYGMPTFFQDGNLVHFAGYAKHIGFYPGGAAVEVFADDLKAYETSKGTVRFPLDKPLPLRLITKIVRYRVGKSGKKHRPSSKSRPTQSKR